MKRSFTWRSDDYSREDSQEAKIAPPVSSEILSHLWPKFLFHFGEEVESTLAAESNSVDKFSYPFSSSSDEDNRLSNDVNEVTFESHEEKQAPEVFEETVVVTPAPQDSEEIFNIDHLFRSFPVATEPEQVTSAPDLDPDDLSLFYHSLRSIFEPQVPQQESSDVIIMVNDVKIQVTRQQKQPTVPIPYYYMASRS